MSQNIFDSALQYLTNKFEIELHNVQPNIDEE